MMKFTIVVLAAFAAVAVALEGETETQSFLSPTNGEETSGLKGRDQIFSDFCIETRDLVLGDIQRSTNAHMSSVFSLLANSAVGFAQEALDTTKMAEGRLGPQIAHPDMAIQPGTNVEEQIVAEGQKYIQDEQSVPKTFMQAIRSTLQSTGTALANKFQQGVEKLQPMIGLPLLVKTISQVCDAANHYENEINDRFTNFKSKFGSDDPLSVRTLTSVPCTTSIRVIRVSALCQLTRNSQAPVSKVLKTARSN